MSEPGSSGNETRTKRVCRPGDVPAANGQHDNIDVVADKPDAVVAQQLPDYSSAVGRFGFDINWQTGHRQPRQLFSVFSGKLDDDKLVAIKRMELIHITQVGEDKLLELNHPSIVKGFAAEQDERYKYYALEMYLGTLDQVFLDDENPSKYRGPLPSDKGFMAQLAAGLDYIHTFGIAHRDIRPENVAIVSPNNATGLTLVKWTGFGLSERVNNNASYETRIPGGSVNWMAPELIEKLGDFPILGTVLADVFSAGLIFFFHLARGVHPFGTQYHDIARNIEAGNGVNFDRLPFWQVTRSAIINVMLARNPLARSNWKNQLTNWHTNLNELKDQMLTLCACESLTATAIDRLFQLVSDDNIDINCSLPIDGSTPLMLLCERNQTEDFYRCFEAIMSRDDINVNAKSKNGMTALHVLCQLNEKLSVAVVEKLIQRGLNVNAVTTDTWNAFHYLCASARCRDMVQVARLLIRSGLDVHARTGRGENALTILCRNSENPNLMETARLLVTEHNLNVNHTDGMGNNALHCLVSRNLYEEGNVLELTRFLIASGINVNALTSQGNDALQLLILEEHSSENGDHAIELIRILAEAGIDPDNNNGLTLLCKNARDPLLSLVTHLFVTEFGVNVNQTNNRGENALHCLFQNPTKSRHLLEIVEFLIGANIMVNAVTTDGSNALHLLCKFVKNDHLLDLVRLLVNAGIDVRALTGDGKSAVSLLWARKEKIPNATEIVQFILDSPI